MNIGKLGVPAFKLCGKHPVSAVECYLGEVKVYRLAAGSLLVTGSLWTAMTGWIMTTAASQCILFMFLRGHVWEENGKTAAYWYPFKYYTGLSDFLVFAIAEPQKRLHILV